MEYLKEFKLQTDWVKRLNKTQILKTKYPQKIPVILDRLNKYTPKPSNHRFLVPQDFTVGQFMTIIRKHLPDLNPSQNIFLFINEKNTIPPMTMLMSELFSQYHEEDNFLYIVISIEQTFG